MSSRAWTKRAIRIIDADFNRSGDTHLVPLRLPAHPGIQLYFKDESSHPTGSLKHRLARSLFLYALANGWISEGTTIVEASSGSTAISEAYFARLLDLPFIAAMPKSTSPEKIERIAFYGGQSHLVNDAIQVVAESIALAAAGRGHFMDQFTYAERATDWRGNNNIAESLFLQMREEPAPEPRYIVCAAGTGGTSATLGRYVRYRRHDTEVVVADPDNSVLYDYYVSGDPTLTLNTGSLIEGIGRPRVEKSFLRRAVDSMVKVPDHCSLAALQYLESALGRRVGGSTGTIFYGALPLIQRMAEGGERGSLVLILCDGGERYGHSYYSRDWLAAHGFDTVHERARITDFLERGEAQDWPVSQHELTCSIN
ncbi:MAG: PLP-dependent cysteine synthase family protein [Gammaproteobacteria bacterium]|nr:PLP-dependent cysteine synthase family protein [Gammaproteobacteria bacterium]